MELKLSLVAYAATFLFAGHVTAAGELENSMTKAGLPRGSEDYFSPNTVAQIIGYLPTDPGILSAYNKFLDEWKYAHGRKQVARPPCPALQSDMISLAKVKGSYSSTEHDYTPDLSLGLRSSFMVGGGVASSFMTNVKANSADNSPKASPKESDPNLTVKKGYTSSPASLNILSYIFNIEDEGQGGCGSVVVDHRYDDSQKRYMWIDPVYRPEHSTYTSISLNDIKMKATEAFERAGKAWAPLKAGFSELVLEAGPSVTMANSTSAGKKDPWYRFQGLVDKCTGSNCGKVMARGAVMTNARTGGINVYKYVNWPTVDKLLYTNVPGEASSGASDLTALARFLLDNGVGERIDKFSVKTAELIKEFVSKDSAVQAEYGAHASEPCPSRLSLTNLYVARAVGAYIAAKDRMRYTERRGDSWFDSWFGTLKDMTHGDTHPSHIDHVHAYATAIFKLNEIEYGFNIEQDSSSCGSFLVRTKYDRSYGWTWQAPVFRKAPTGFTSIGTGRKYRRVGNLTMDAAGAFKAGVKAWPPLSEGFTHVTLVIDESQVTSHDPGNARDPYFHFQGLHNTTTTELLTNGKLAQMREDGGVAVNGFNGHVNTFLSYDTMLRYGSRTHWDPENTKPRPQVVDMEKEEQKAFKARMEGYIKEGNDMIRRERGKTMKTWPFH